MATENKGHFLLSPHFQMAFRPLRVRERTALEPSVAETVRARLVPANEATGTGQSGKQSPPSRQLPRSLVCGAQPQAECKGSDTAPGSRFSRPQVLAERQRARRLRRARPPSSARLRVTRERMRRRTRTRAALRWAGAPSSGQLPLQSKRPAAGRETRRGPCWPQSHPRAPSPRGAGKLTAWPGFRKDWWREGRKCSLLAGAPGSGQHLRNEANISQRKRGAHVLKTTKH